MQVCRHIFQFSQSLCGWQYFLSRISQVLLSQFPDILSVFSLTIIKSKSLPLIMLIILGKGVASLILAWKFSFFISSEAYSCNWVLAKWWLPIKEPHHNPIEYQDLHWHYNICSLTPCITQFQRYFFNIKPKSIQNLNSFWNYFSEIRIKIVARNPWFIRSNNLKVWLFWF